MTDLAQTFAALSDSTRLSIVERLMREGELPAGSLAQGTGISGAAVSRHLKVLRTAGLVSQRSVGTHRMYSADPEPLSAISRWTETQKVFWEKSLDRLAEKIALDPEE